MQLVVISVTFVLLVARAWAGPEIDCAEAVWDVGTISPRDTVSHLFVIMNTGDDTLEITAVHDCCGAESGLSTNSIHTRGSAELAITLTVQGRVGSISKTIHVESNDPDKRFLQLELRGRIDGAIEPLSEVMAKPHA